MFMSYRVTKFKSMMIPSADEDKEYQELSKTDAGDVK
jgi:hypothetical protein